MATKTEIVNTLTDILIEALDINKGDLKNVSINPDKKTITITIPYHEVEEDGYVGFTTY